MTPKISVQLYSLREEANTDFPGVLRRLGEIGYSGVELAGFNGLTPAEFATIANDCGLVVSSAHVGATDVDGFNAALDELQTVGTTKAILPFLSPGEFKSADKISRHAETINSLNAIAVSRGMTFGYHNHFWEFQINHNGRSAWDVLFDQLDASVTAELDTYWATLGGADIPATMADLGERLTLIHVKDGPATEPELPMVAVGSGAIDVPMIIANAPHAHWHIVELDQCATDMFDAVEASYTYLTSTGLSAGRK